MRINNNSEFNNGTYSPKRISSLQQIVAGNSTVTSGGTLVCSASSNPYLSFHESSARRAYVQYLTTDHELYLKNEESNVISLASNGDTILELKKGSNKFAQFGFFDGTNDDVYLRHGNDDWIIYGRANANTWIYYNNDWKIKTEPAGVTINDSDTNVVLYMRTNDTVRGSLYATSSNEIGILDEGGNWAYKHTNDNSHYWYINDTERMHLDNNGLRVQTQYGYVDIGPSNGSYCHITTDRSQFYFNQRLVVNSGQIQSYDEDLNLNRTGSTTARLRITSGSTISDQDLTVNSDERIKDNIKQIDGALEKVQAIRGVTYNRIDTDDPEKEHTGVIAQDVEKVLPQVVHEDGQGIKSVAYGNMVGLLIEAIKEQQTQIDDLKAEVTRLKGFE